MARKTGLEVPAGITRQRREKRIPSRCNSMVKARNAMKDMTCLGNNKNFGVAGEDSF